MREPRIQQNVGRWRLRRVSAVARVALQLFIGGVGGAMASFAVAEGNLVQKPTVMNLYPDGSATDQARLFILITSVGAHRFASPEPLAFDTGSPGVTVYAQDVFPPDTVSFAGFVFPKDQHSLTYQNITVTDLAVSRPYGGKLGKTETGNLGFAQVTFGDAAGSFSTGVMPILFYYRITDNSTNLDVPAPAQRGWFGVNSSAGLFNVKNSPKPAAGFLPCSLQSKASCYVVSPLKFLSYASDVDAGFLLQGQALQTCSIRTAGSCHPKPMLTIGLNANLERDFSTFKLVCPPSNNPTLGPINGYPACSPAIPHSTVTIAGSKSTTLSGEALFDSGSPTMLLQDAAGSLSSPLEGGTPVAVTLPGGFKYAYKAGGGTYTTIVNPGGISTQVLGIAYFTTNALFVDFTTSTEGWK